MSIKQVKVSVADITMGMYVSCLDRPWSQTPFPIQGLLVKSPKEISALRNYCEYVYIDVTKGSSPVVTIQQPSKVGPRTSPALSTRVAGMAVETSPIDVKRGVYSRVVPLSEEVQYAEKGLMQLRGHFALAVKQIAKGRDFDYQGLKDSVGDMVNSVVRCPDAFTWLLRLRLKDQHSHDHSMRSALWAVQFARFVGMPKEEMSVLCLGTLLKDIGKIKLPNGLLRKRKRTPEEVTEYQKFVDYGVEMLRSSNVEPRVVSVVRFHCERHDGSGFPEGLQGGKIPLLARIAGIATTYDAISNPREAEEPVAPSRAVSLLYNLRDKKFQDDLVVQFIQSIGLYPTGTLVELTTGDVGIVVEQHAESRLTPKVAVLDQKKAQASGAYILVDLKDEGLSRRILEKSGQSKAKSVSKLAIARDLDLSGYDVDIAAVSGIFMKNAQRVMESVVSDNPEIETPARQGGLYATLRDRFRL
ncbi:HD-GYP domain-containing protein [uncultured Porticoccus sp.]|uniref:HD-GYP domain-containing protein n=1 Tax=uncultured Porticoccus sp. TaxID=1256050 RepID=UPI002615F5D3|nr:HD-GYP domain-containing protein [uncultured Porticoccus sp.]